MDDPRTSQQQLVRVRDNSYAIDLVTGKGSFLAGTDNKSAETVTIVSKPFPYVVYVGFDFKLHEMILVKDVAGHIHMVLNEIKEILE